MQAWATWSRGWHSCPWQGVETMRSLRPLPIQGAHPIPSYSRILDSMIQSNSILFYDSIFWIATHNAFLNVLVFPQCAALTDFILKHHRPYVKKKKAPPPQAMDKCLDLPAHLAHITVACAKVMCAMYCYTLVVHYGLARLFTHRNMLQIMWQMMKAYI